MAIKSTLVDAIAAFATNRAVYVRFGALAFLTLGTVALCLHQPPDTRSLAAFFASDAVRNSTILLLIIVFAQAVTNVENALGSARRQIAALQRDAFSKAGTPEEQVQELNRRLDARVRTVELCRSDQRARERSLEAGRSPLLRSCGAYLRSVTATPANRHIADGLSPAATFLGPELRSTFPRPVGVPDTLVRLGLLGTFVGIIAALSNAVGQLQGGDNQSMISPVQELLKTAATKFWISAAALLLAILARLYLDALGRRLDSIASRAGALFDTLTATDGFEGRCCPSADASFEPVVKRLEQLTKTVDKSVQAWSDERKEIVRQVAETQIKALERMGAELRAGIDSDSLREIGDEIARALRPMADSGSTQGLLSTLARLHGAMDSMVTKIENMVSGNKRSLDDELHTAKAVIVEMRDAQLKAIDLLEKILAATEAE